MTERILRGDHCRCTACDEYFNSTKAFDKHRRGSYPERRCLSSGEMIVAGMSRNTDGWWISRADGRAAGYISSDDGSDDLPEQTPEVRPAA